MGPASHGWQARQRQGQPHGPAGNDPVAERFGHLDYVHRKEHLEHDFWREGKQEGERRPQPPVRRQGRRPVQGWSSTLVEKSPLQPEFLLYITKIILPLTA